ncbi:MAG: PTS sugar transporter subunit IIA [Sphaerochaetaceae bacterium]|jgi:mannitol/fructose-specific phosphotransferase system IIA component (Ntr-type)|nr:PTS sugar transporter subunit IIA [Sphaerochaetaceae bacterium]MDD3671522.1 PTS sugar transporter subunit IIA [Sphaerochaetaceae bacterium]MDD4841280.1 PTS sugar transporter subunit IIA [Sphaerochaetaceae bacterium]MDX9934277.1 PTS sugar transporter subunit IIA [Sphaerochaetaceae bacterium]
MDGLCNRLKKECILLDPPVKTMDQLLHQLVMILSEHEDIKDTNLLYEEIMKQEQMGSTCVGCGCAIPHARTDALNHTVLAVARIIPPIPSATFDNLPISLVFLMAGPKKSASLHLRLLSKLARLLHDQTFREQLFQVPDQESFYSLLCEGDKDDEQ